ncbi:MAG: glutamine--fructose-6-phosphate transaminase (isomerizing) [Dehalococcoidales bacterium]|nr:glutamine--fructose-6-phosphate transaminase (isomerizing) [Dehalococcoidales bacterium]
MCGIVGFVGKRPAQNVLISCLEKLEYRGYDSCGIALANDEITVYKDAIRIASLAKIIPASQSTTGIGHTRWATHGPPNKINAHPHCDCTNKICVVHNGVINNYLKLKLQLQHEGHKIISETDTEIISHLIEKYYQGDPESALSSALNEIEGSYAVIVMVEGFHSLFFARKDSPLVLGIGDRENYIASDVSAMLEQTNRVIFLEEGDTGTITEKNIVIKQNGRRVEREVQRIQWSAEQSQKGGYEYFMLKEIHEQPRVVRDTIAEYLAVPRKRLDIVNRKDDNDIMLIACGSSFHSALVGKYICERILNVNVRVEMASEFNYFYNQKLCPLVIGITQSGETADTLKALRRAKEAEAKVIVITNVVGSTASRLASDTIYTRAGPEISVAATKTFTAQLIALFWLAISESRMDPRIQSELVRGFRQLPDKVQQVLEQEEVIAKHAASLAEYDNVFYIGRGINYPIAMEGALKLKEISYIHAEAFAAGEIKHGPFALLSFETPVVAILAHDKSYDAMLTSIKEIKARGCPVYVIEEDNDENIKNLADYLIPIPSVAEIYSPFVNTVVIQLIAYYAARKRNCPIDFPRNLAKSVTVE